MNKHLKKILCKGGLFVLLLVLMDFSIGHLVRFYFFRQETGKYARITHTIEKTKQELIIFGSSHANRHYVPEVFQRELGLSCYNAGIQGQGILCIDAVQALMLKRHVPRVVILNIDEQWLFTNDSKYDLLGDLNPYYYKYKKELLPFLVLKNKWAKYKLYSILYQYNSTVAHILRYRFKSQPDLSGYKPLFGVLKKHGKTGEKKQVTVDTKKTLDPNFIVALERFISKTNDAGSRIFFVTSPRVEPNRPVNASYDKIKKIANNHAIPLLEYGDHPHFEGRHELFFDPHHLNHTGAQLFSTIVAQEIKERLKEGTRAMRISEPKGHDI